MPHLDDLLDLLEAARDDRALKSALRGYATRIGFDRFAFLDVQGRDTSALSNYPEDWQTLYLKNGYATIDPVVASAKRTMRITSWSADHHPFLRHSTEWSFFGEAVEFGLRSGLSIPVRTGFGRTAILTFASGRPTPVYLEHLDQYRVRTAVAFLHLTLGRRAEMKTRSPDVDLTPRETLCLTWASHGKAMKGTAEILGISERSVRFYLDAAREKLGADNVTHAVRIAVERRLI